MANITFDRIENGNVKFVQDGNTRWLPFDILPEPNGNTITLRAKNQRDDIGPINLVGNSIYINGVLTTGNGDAIAEVLATDIFFRVAGGVELVIDASPTDGSANAVSSNGVFDSLATKVSSTGNETIAGEKNFSGKIKQNGFEQENYAGDQYYTVTGTNKHIFRNTTTNVQAQLTETSDFELMQNGKGIIAKSPNGTKYKLVPPNGGGAATWVAV